MVPGIPDRFNELFDDMVRSRMVRVAHPEVNDILAPVTGFQLQRLNLRKDIRRKPLEAVKLVHGTPSSNSASSSRDRQIAAT